MLNRSIIIIKYKQPMIDWINGVEPDDETEINLENTNNDRTTYLIGDDDLENLDVFLKDNFLLFFENELEGWYLDEDCWPADLTFPLFQEFFQIEFHSMIEDLGDEALNVDEDDFEEGEEDGDEDEKEED